MFLPVLHRNLAREPRRNRARIARNDRIIVQPLSQFPCYNLRFHWLIVPRALFLHKLVPLLHFFLRFFQEVLILILLQFR